MKCIVHIGTEKTGTTALQQWLQMKSTQRVLGKHGMYLCDVNGSHSGREVVAYCQSHMDDWTARKRIFTPAEKEEYLDDLSRRLQDDVQKASQDHSTYLISSEHFHSRLKSADELIRLRQLLAPLFDGVRIVAYFREPAQAALSFYSTYLIGDGTRTLDDFLDEVTPSNYRYNCKSIADAWSGIFSGDSCDFRIYDKAAFGHGELRTHFLSTLALPATVAHQTDGLPRSNESLSGLQAELIRFANELWPLRNAEGDGVNATNLKVKALVRSSEALRLGPISSPRIGEVSERFREVNQAFFDTYFGGEYQFRPPPSYLAEAGKTSFTIDEVRQLLLAAMAHICPSVPSRFSAVNE